MTTPLGTPNRKRDITLSHYLAASFDLRRSDLGFRKFRGSDVLAMKSQSVGIGISCLLFRRLWGFPLKGIEPIAARGKRFDYRAKKDQLTAVFEAKGSTSRPVQNRQIKDGIAKKLIQRRAGVRADIELVVSTRLTPSISTPSSITLADPTSILPAWTFDEDGDLFYETRHWVRVLNFIGATHSAKRLNRFNLRPDAESGSPNIVSQKILPVPTVSSDDDKLEYLTIEGMIFVGQWSTVNITAPDGTSPFERIFHGLLLDAYHSLLTSGDYDKPGQYRVLLDPSQRVSGSVHEDYSALFFQHRFQ